MDKKFYLMAMRDYIEKQGTIVGQKIFNILNKKINYTENNNGIFFNIAKIDEDTIKEMETYLRFVDLQEKQLEKGEKAKLYYKKVIVTFN